MVPNALFTQVTSPATLKSSSDLFVKSIAGTLDGSTGLTPFHGVLFAFFLLKTELSLRVFQLRLPFDGGWCSLSVWYFAFI
jgi:hypothetical protein